MGSLPLPGSSNKVTPSDHHSRCGFLLFPKTGLKKHLRENLGGPCIDGLAAVWASVGQNCYSNPWKKFLVRLKSLGVMDVHP